MHSRFTGSGPCTRRWFLSFNSSDRALAERLKVSIERKDAGSRVFYDETSLRAGGYWQPTLAKGIDEADAFVLLVGEKGLGPWQTLEYYEAHDKHARRRACSPRSRAKRGRRRPARWVRGRRCF